MGITIEAPDPASVGFGPLGSFSYTANTTTATNRAHASACHTDTSLTFNRIGLYIATSSGNIDVGVYDDDGAGGIPGTLLVSSGSTASPGTGLRRVTVAQTTVSGSFWIAVGVDNATISFGYAAGVQWYDVFAGADTLRAGTTRGRRGTTSSYPLPSTWSDFAADGAVVPTLWVEKV